MPISNDSLNKKLYELLKTQGFNPVPKNSKGDTTPVPDEADVFKFTFKVDNKPIGPAWVTVDSNQQLRVYYNDEVMDSVSEDGGKGHIDSFTEFLQQLKKWAQRRQLGFELENQDHLESDMAQREYVKKQEQINEGYYPMGKSASYNDSVPSVKIILQHTRQIQEGEQRFRNIARIFLENTVGERILAPTTRPGIAKVYARHLAEGGLPHDDRWNHIGSLVEEYTKMAGFVRATRGNQFNESAQKLVNEGINHYQSLRETLSRMIGHKGYNAYFENYTPALMETEGEESNLNELFVQETLDPRIESVMPILSRIHKKVNEMNEVKALEEWADKIIEDESLTSNNTMGIPESLQESHMSEVDMIVQDIINGELDAYDIMNHPKTPEEKYVADLLLNQYEEVARDHRLHPDDDFEQILDIVVDNLAKDYGHPEEVEEGFSDIAKKVGGTLKMAGKKALDVIAPDDETLLRDLQKRAGIPKHAQHGKPRMAIPNDEKDMMENDGEPQVKPGMKTSQGTIVKVDGNTVTVKASNGELMTMNIHDVSDASVSENLDSNQKRVGQLGPTEKITKKNPLRGKLVGANESIEENMSMEIDPGITDFHAISIIKYLKRKIEDKQLSPDPKEIMRAAREMEMSTGKQYNLPLLVQQVLKGYTPPSRQLSEMDKSQPSSDRGGESSGDPYAKGGKATPITAKKTKKDFLDILQKNVDKANKDKKETDKKVAKHQDVKEGALDDVRARMQSGSSLDRLRASKPDSKLNQVRAGMAARGIGPNAEVEEAKWDPTSHGDFPLNYDADNLADAIGSENAEKLEAMREYYLNNAYVERAINEVMYALSGKQYDDTWKTRLQWMATFKDKNGKTHTEMFNSKQDAYRYAQQRKPGKSPNPLEFVSIEKLDMEEHKPEHIMLPVMLGTKNLKKKWMLPFPDEHWAQRWEFKHKDVAQILWPEGHALERPPEEEELKEGQEDLDAILRIIKK